MTPAQLKQVSEQLFSEQQVADAIVNMGQCITRDYLNKNPIVLCVVVGGIYVTGQLMPHLKFPLRLNYIHASRYQGSTLGYELTWKARPTIDLKNQHILLVDDILDEGITLEKVKDYCLSQGAASVKAAVLIDKEPCRHAQGMQQADYVGLYAGDDYLFGCGLDCHEFLRNEAAVYSIPTDVLESIQKKNEELITL